ncbi:MarR family winged helix-turn-helix transcriptional regulator [Corynebacterium epidermidicanis]|uniref:Transcriptional regulator n=1 Tax=Corynebacterium epidermidicanis TaxID=1050174 RepID=A0A0G3GZK1_9CORY|nr:MarR family transcriptional regulator [Corynebacterium epidermidicanis]AKK04237.1 transcriptional regulator [Corynebacterium epidermidicanis]
MSALTPEQVSDAVRPALTKLYVTYFRKATPSSLSGPQLTILTSLAEGEARRISDIARQEGIRMPTASNTLHQLEQRKLVERVRDETDRRGVHVQITESGLAELQKVGEERSASFAKILATLTPEELAQIDAVVPIINKMSEVYPQPDQSE